MQAAAQPRGGCGKFRDDVVELARHLIQERGLDPGNRCKLGRFGRFHCHGECYKIAFPCAVWPIIWPITTWPMLMACKTLYLETLFYTQHSIGRYVGRCRALRRGADIDPSCRSPHNRWAPA